MRAVHTKVSSLADSGSPALVQPSDWNAAHQVTLDRQGATIGATVTPVGTDDITVANGLNQATAFANPSGTAEEGWGHVIKYKDNGTSRALSWGSEYRDMLGGGLPTATTVGKWTYASFVRNVPDSKWDLVGLITQP